MEPIDSQISTLTVIALAVALTACSSDAATHTSRPEPTNGPSSSPCRAQSSCWPSEAEWQALRAKLTGKLLHPDPSPASTNPYELEDRPGATQSRGWLDAWTAAPSVYAVAAETSTDVALAVRFATAHHIKLVVRGTGHDYLGRSSAPDSLMVWTHPMRAVTMVDSFVPQGCALPGVPAVDVGAGARWGEAYKVVSVEHGRYVQGGGCTSVGVAGGFLQGGGFGSWSKKFGPAAAGLLEAEIVTADGQVRIANACQNADLFWALRGGGGGTFGIVTRVTLATYDLPPTFGIASGTITAKSDAAYHRLVGEFVAFSHDHLVDEHWGETVELNPDNTLRISMLFEGLDQNAADLVWQPFRAWLAAHHDEVDAKLEVRAFPASVMWNAAILKSFPDAIQLDERETAEAGTFWWKGDASQIGAYWYAYHSRWISNAVYGNSRSGDALFESSRHWSLELHFNKGLGGASPDAVSRAKETSMNPAMLDAATLVVIGARADAGAVPDPAAGARARASTLAAMAPILALTPASGSYVNETDYFEPDWQRSFWGSHYVRLLAIKRAVDPTNVFTCHHCVGSE